MTASPDTIRSARRIGGLRRIVSRHPVAAFLAMVFAVNIAIVCVPVMGRGDAVPVVQMPLYGIFGPIFGVALPAFLVVAATGGRAFANWRVGACADPASPLVSGGPAQCADRGAGLRPG